MNTELKKLEVSEEPLEPLQSGELIVGLSSAIPGFIKKDATHNAISFAPFFMRDHWVNLPIATVQEVVPVPDGKAKEDLSLSLAFRPGIDNEKILLDLISALAQNNKGMKIAKGNGRGTVAVDASTVASYEHGICRNCKRGDESCVDCFLA